MRPCAKCSNPVRSKGQRYCPEHHAEAQREHRKSNGYAVANRQRKAARIVEKLWKSLSDEQRVDPTMVFLVRTSDQKTRDVVCSTLGEKNPSEECWALVVEAFAERVKVARWGWHRGQEVA